MMPRMTPDKLNGQDILRPVVEENGTPRLASTSVYFPPTISIVYPPEPIGLLVEREAQRIVSMRAMTTSELRVRLNAFALEVIENERRKGVKTNG